MISPAFSTSPQSHPTTFTLRGRRAFLHPFKELPSTRTTMEEFTLFGQLPKELKLQIWEAAIPRSPSVHFLSYPPKGPRSRGTYQWQSELANINRTVNVDKDLDTGEPSTRARTWGRYSSYFANLALLQACQESRRVCLAQAASCNVHGSDSSNIVSTSHYTLNLDTDIICIQDPDSRFPWNRPRRLSLYPALDPLRIALERRPYLDCNETEYVGDWLRQLAGGDDGEFGLGTSLGDETGILRLNVIYLLDYDIKPKHEIVAGTTTTTDDGTKTRNNSEFEPADRSAVKLSGQKSTHNGKFHGHGVTFYALSANIEETCVGWVIPQESRDFCFSVFSHISHRYGYAIVPSPEEAKTDEYKICVEFLACVKA